LEKHPGHPLRNLPKVIVVDANFIVAYCSTATPPDDRARIEYFIERAEKAKSKVVFPMVAVAEFLVGADLAGVEFLNTLDRKAHIQMADFNRAAAFELAQLDRAAIGSGDKKDESEQPWQKIKTDRQLVATGKSLGAQLVISNDKAVRNNALRINMQAMRIQELELPESAKQMHLVPPIKTIPKSKSKPVPLKVIRPSPGPAPKAD
jgi:predicted nucleic acid-binding protein